MTNNFIKVVISCFAFVCVTSQVFSSPAITPSSSQEESSKEHDVAAQIPVEKLTPTDPLEINKMAFQFLQSNFGNVGPILYALVTEKNALGEPSSKLSELIANKIGLENFIDDMKLIFDNALDPEIQKRALEIYDKIKDVKLSGTDESLNDAVEILKNIFTNEETVEEIGNIIKNSEN